MNPEEINVSHFSHALKKINKKKCFLSTRSAY